jgi:phage N-6-adenine-methyltransferase
VASSRDQQNRTSEQINGRGVSLSELTSSFYTGPALSSATDKWATPADLFCALDRIFDFDLDVRVSADNATCERYFTEADDGLAQQWTGTCWMNPPYGRTIIKWMAKAHAASLEGATVVCLVPVRTDTRWWQQYATKAQDIRFLPGRLKFGNAQSSAPFPSAIVVFKPPVSLEETF